MVDPERFRELMASWPSGVTIVAYRDEARVVATTVTAFLSLSLEPPQVLVALGPNATVRPFLVPGASFGVSILAGDQRRLATIFADPFPVGAEPFPASGVPVLADALVALECSVASVVEATDHALITGAVRSAAQRDAPPLIRYRRRYHALDV